jgi:hypothetical protein
MIKSGLALLAAAAVLFASVAHAASITNRDVQEHYLQIVDETGETETQEIVIAANQSVENICMEGCTINLDDGEPMAISGSEQLVIEDGVLAVEQ